MKIPLQDKIAELEQRIVELEKRQHVNAVSTQRITMQPTDLEPEMSTIWASVDKLFKKVFP